ncbi:MAG TPA: GAF domain-containing protein [Cyclobacteriaceae bacterium]
MVSFIRRNFFSAVLLVIIILIMISFLFTLYNRQVMITNNVLKRQTEEVKEQMDVIFSMTLRQIDLGLRGYALTGSEQLLSPYTSAFQLNEENLWKIDSLFRVQKLDTTIQKFAVFKKELYAYLEHCKMMKAEAERGNIDEFVRLLNMDKGYFLWQTFSPINDSIIRYEDELVQKSQERYEAALNGNVFFQLILLLISAPMLGIIIFRSSREARERNELLSNFRRSNRKYIFDPGDDNDEGGVNAEEIIETSTRNLREASTFINQITQGNYDVTWKGLDERNREHNKDSLAGYLITMRDEMRRVKKEDAERLWVTEGLTAFSELVRNNQHSLNALSDAVVSYLARYLRVQQAAFYVLQEENGEDPHLKLISCYAFEKKKFIEKRIDPGTGVLGQCFLEGTTTLLTDVPNGYTKITSGLGEATPRCLAIVPMKHNEKVECILELAGFTRLEEFEVSFLEKAGEFVASAIYSVRNAENTAELLRQAQESTEMMRAQEEEMRQNMEELQATQEEMARKEKEINRLLETTRQNEEAMKRKVVELEKQRAEEVRRLKEQLAKL